jgi:ABC-2 type transport system ATP-binding protein
VIIVDRITKKYKKDFWATPTIALENVSFQIKEHEVIGFLGANGAGKTTCIKSIFNFIKPDDGKILFEGKLGNSLHEALGRTGYLPERPYFYPHLTGEEFVLYMAQLNDVKKKDATQSMNYWAKRFKLDHAMKRKIHGYSKGMLQRIGFISILIHNPEILILDEPLSGLDPVGRKEFKDVFRELAREGKTLFFSSHIVSDIEEVCKKVVVLETGRLLYEGEISDLIKDHSSLHYEVSIDSAERDLAIEGLNFVERRVQHNIFRISDEKDKILKQVVDSGYAIEGLTAIRPTLEEIIYKIRS